MRGGQPAGSLPQGSRRQKILRDGVSCTHTRTPRKLSPPAGTRSTQRALSRCPSAPGPSGPFWSQVGGGGRPGGNERLSGTPPPWHLGPEGTGLTSDEGQSEIGHTVYDRVLITGDEKQGRNGPPRQQVQQWE